jgi:hypothetical protein
MTYETSVSTLNGPETKPTTDNIVIGNFPDGRFSLGDWWRDPMKTGQHVCAVVAGLAIVVGLVVGLYQLNDIWNAGEKKADEVTIEYNRVSANGLKSLFTGVEDISPSLEDIDAVYVAGDKATAAEMTATYRVAAAKLIAGKTSLNYDAKTFYTDLNNTAICLNDGCSRDALVRNMGFAYCRADRKFGTWLADYRKMPTNSGFAQQYVDLLATLPCDKILYETDSNAAKIKTD